VYRAVNVKYYENESRDAEFSLYKNFVPKTFYIRCTVALTRVSGKPFMYLIRVLRVFPGITETDRHYTGYNLTHLSNYT